MPLREIRAAAPDDLDAVRGMHEAMSPENRYLRFFSMSKNAAEQEARRLCRPAGPDHAALLACLDGKVVGAASYEPAGTPGEAEVAFAVTDDMHGRGVATLLLEHLVSLARMRHLRAFTAETLAENSAMLRVFADAGLGVRRHWADGVVELTIPIPRQAALSQASLYLETVAGREQRADVASLAPLLRPASVAVVGASRREGSVGRTILRNIRDAGFAGPVYAVNPNAGEIGGVRCVHSVAALPEPVDLAVIAVPPPAVAAAAQECGERGIKALVVITAGLDSAQEADILAICRHHGMRLVGPNCFGVAVPGLGLDATFGARHPAAGRAGLGVQSGGIGIALMEQLSRLGIGSLVVRVAGRQAGCVGQRPAVLVGAGRRDRAGRAVPGVARQPPQVRPHRQPGRQEDARADRARGQVRAGRAGRRLAHRGHRGPADHPAGPVRAGRRHRHGQPGRADRRGRAARRPAAARRAAGWPSSRTPAGRACWPPTPAPRRA